MNAPALLAELRCEGIEVEARGDRLVIRGPREAMTGALRARVLGHKPELLALLRREGEQAEVAWAARELACYRAYVAALARGFGYDEESIALACEWMARRGGAFRVTSERIEIQLGDGVVAVVRHPAHATSARGADNRIWP